MLHQSLNTAMERLYMASPSSGVSGLVKTIIESIFLVVVAGALFPFLADTIAAANFTSAAAATIIALLPLFLALAMAYRLITSALRQL